MAAELTVTFKTRYASGAAIEAEFRLPLEPPSITVLFGPSGSGKTTILRALAGLERPESGRIQFSDELWLDTPGGVFRPARKRRIGYLFQEYALFPHLTVRQNIAYGLSHLPRAEREKQIAATENLLQLDDWEDRYPGQLSGGEKQRVALARTLATQPRLLLLDEPLSALDTPIREKLRAELGDFLHRLRIPTILVTHDRGEAQALADQLIVVAEGRIQQIGPVDFVFDHPANEVVARFLGFETVTPARVTETRGHCVLLEASQRRLIASAPDLPGRDVLACIRADDVTLAREAPMPNGDWNEIPAVVVGLAREGRAFRATLDCGFALAALVDRDTCAELGLRTGAQVTAFVRADAVRLVPSSSS